MNVFCCPVCGLLMEKSGGALYCKNGHAFDISRKGYVNLYIHGNKGIHGDDKTMLNARSAFLDKGYYAPLQEFLLKQVQQITNSSLKVLDLGCADGYYLSAFKAIPGAELIGIDISKYAVCAAKRRLPEMHAAVASCSMLPLESAGMDVVISVFAPVKDMELKRILKPDGRVFMVLPGPNHLYELKQAVYQNAYLNPEPKPDLKGFNAFSKQCLSYKMDLSQQDDILNLFMMTPYYYRSSPRDKKKLSKINKLTVTAEFYIFCLEHERKD